MSKPSAALGCLSVLAILWGVGWVMNRPNRDLRADVARTEDYNRRRKAYESVHNGKVTLLSVRVVPLESATGRGIYQVLIDWRNDGAEPVGTIWANVRAFDASGAETFSSEDECPYAAEPSEGTAPIPPGGVYRTPEGKGEPISAVDAGPPVRAEVTITYAGPSFPEEP